MNNFSRLILINILINACVTEFNILHFNDAYEIKNTPKFLADFLKEYTSLGEDKTLKLFSGDLYFPSETSSWKKGTQFDDFLKNIKMDAAVIGNHELDKGIEYFNELNQKGFIPWIVSNVKDKKGNNFAGLEAYKTFTKDGLKIGVFGLLNKAILKIMNFKQDQIDSEDFMLSAQRMSKYLRETEACDVVIALTHLNNADDIKLVENSFVEASSLGAGQQSGEQSLQSVNMEKDQISHVSAGQEKEGRVNPAGSNLSSESVPNTIDFVLGGHDHIVYGYSNERSFLLKSGLDFERFSTLKLKFEDQPLSNCQNQDQVYQYELDKKSVDPLTFTFCLKRGSRYLNVQITNRMVDQNVEVDPSYNRVVDDILAEQKKRTGQLVAIADQDFTVQMKKDPKKPNFMLDLVMEILRIEADADVSFVNARTFRMERTKDKDGKELTYSDLNSLFPFFNSCVILELLGQQILDGLNILLDSPTGFVAIGGMTMSVKPKGEVFEVNPTTILINEKPLEKTRKYKVWISSFVKEKLKDIISQTDQSKIQDIETKFGIQIVSDALELPRYSSQMKDKYPGKSFVMKNDNLFYNQPKKIQRIKSLFKHYYLGDDYPVFVIQVNKKLNIKIEQEGTEEPLSNERSLVNGLKKQKSILIKGDKMCI